MSSPHPDIGPELRQLAQAILDRLDPAVRAAAAMAAESMRGPGRCEQVWCPLCALAALLNGEQHPLLLLMAEHSGTLMTLIRDMTADPQPAPADAGDAEPRPAGDAPPSTQNGRYHRIPIVVEPVGEDAATDTSDL
jgi:hypothetical protein